jgi:hypothetical protein
MRRTLKTAYLALAEALRILLGRPAAVLPPGTGGAIG